MRPTHQIAPTEADTPAPPPTRSELRARVVQAIKALRDTRYAWVLTREGRRALFAAYKRGQRGEMLPLHHLFSLPLQMAHAHGCHARRADRLRGHGALRVLRAPWCKHNPGEGEG